jgi:hypothetical protein
VPGVCHLRDLPPLTGGIGRPEELCSQYSRDESRRQARLMSIATPPAAATVSYAALVRSLSRERFQAYSLETDYDSADAAARYLWNMALGAAITPVLHLVEVALRNALYEVGCETTSHRRLKTATIPCWLDAVPTLLEPREASDVATAVRRLGTNRRRYTPGHLVGQLGFGFWVALCDRPYEHGRPTVPNSGRRRSSAFSMRPSRAGIAPPSGARSSIFGTTGISSRITSRSGTGTPSAGIPARSRFSLG